MLVSPPRVASCALIVLAWLANPADAAECTTRSDTGCRIACAEGTLSLVCPKGKKKCTGRCFTGKGREHVARCRSGSGSKCAVSCDRGTQSLVCTDASERCQGRCADLTADAVTWLPDETRGLDFRLASFQPAPTSEAQPPDPAERYFQQLVADVFWASGVQERPSTVAVELWEALDHVERGKKKSSVLEENLGGDEVELHVGLRPRKIARLRAGLASFVDRLRLDETFRRRFDQEVQALTRSLLLEDVSADHPPDPMPLTVHNRNCEGPQTFRVSSETRWIRFRGETTFSGLGPGQSATAQVAFDLTGVEPGRHRGHFVVECLTCPAECRVDRSHADIYVEVAEPIH